MLQIKMAQVNRSLKRPGADEVGSALTRALELSEGLDDESKLFPILRGLRLFYSQRLELAKGSGFGERLLEVPERSEDPQVISDACLSPSDMSVVSGDQLCARRQAEEELATTSDPLPRRRPPAL